MRHLLAPEQNAFLHQLAENRLLLAFDFDGTLAPIVANRDLAEMADTTRHLLQQLCSLYPVAVVSGRSCADVTSRIRSLGVKYVIGNHGLEPGNNLSAFEREIASLRSALEPVLRTHTAVEIEDKRYSLAIHFRHVRDQSSAKAAIVEAVQALARPIRIVHGKSVVNLVPADAPNKGDAVLDLLSHDGAACVMFVGDDVTDEDVFRIQRPKQIVGVRIGRSLKSDASYYLRRQSEMDLLLKRLISLREKGEVRV